MGKEVNRIKAVLAESGKTNLWLAEQLGGGNPTTVSKWCTNTCHPDLYTFSRIAKLPHPLPDRTNYDRTDNRHRQ